MSKRWWMMAGALLLLCAAVPMAQAAGEKQLVVKLGSSMPNGDYGTIASNGAMVGLDVGYKVDDRFALGMEVGYFRNAGFRDGQSFEIYDPTVSSAVTITLAESWSVSDLGAWGKCYFLRRNWVAPYLRAGTAVCNVAYNYDVRASSKSTNAGGRESSNKFGMSGGLGLSFKIAKNTALGLEGVYHKVLMRGDDVTFWTIGGTLGFGPGGK